MQDRGASLPLIGLSFTTFALAASALAPLAGRISDRYGRWRPILADLVLSGIVYCVYGLRLSPGWIIVLALVEGAGLAVVRVATDGFLADHVPQGIQGRIHALFSTAGTAGSLLGATVSGFLYAMEPGVPLLAMGVLYLLVPVALPVVPANGTLAPGLADSPATGDERMARPDRRSPSRHTSIPRPARTRPQR
jgi:MFS family permease